MSNLVAERLARFVLIEADGGLRCCSHVPVEHGESRPSYACGLHPEVGLLCLACMDGHALEVHEDELPCDYCAREITSETGIRQRIFSWWANSIRVLPPGDRSGEPLLLLMPQVVAFCMPLVCAGEMCDRLASTDVGAVEAEIGAA